MDDLYQFAVHGTGPLTGSGATEIYGFINTVNTEKADVIANQFTYFPHKSPDMDSFVDSYKDDIKRHILHENKYRDILFKIQRIC